MLKCEKSVLKVTDELSSINTVSAVFYILSDLMRDNRTIESSSLEQQFSNLCLRTTFQSYILTVY